MSIRKIRGQVVFTDLPVLKAAGNYTLTNEAGLVLNKTIGAATGVTLPANPERGRAVMIVDGKGDAATHNITITPAAGTVDGASNLLIASNYGAVALMYNGTEWNATEQDNWNGQNLTVPGNLSVVGTMTVGGASGLAAPIQARLMDGRNTDGSVIVASATAGKFGISKTNGPLLALVGEAAQNNTKTDIVCFELGLPANYKAGNTITLTINAQHVESGGTTLTNTLTPTGYIIANDGTEGTDVIGASATAVTGAAADYTFTIPAAGLVAGGRLLVSISSVATEGGNSGTTINQINSVRLS